VRHELTEWDRRVAEKFEVEEKKRARNSGYAMRREQRGVGVESCGGKEEKRKEEQQQ
jgi:hypothetical protein